MNKKLSLEKIAKEIEKCKECKKNKFGKAVPGEGNPKAEIMFIGEAPGYNESKVGLPFVGRAGKFLTKMLDNIGIKREEVFITSPVKYFPGRRAPTLEEIKHGMIHTRKQIEIIKPKLIVLLGNVAIKAMLDKDLKVSNIHGKVIKKDNVKFLPTFHPSAAMRFPKIKILMERDFKKIKDLFI